MLAPAASNASAGRTARLLDRLLDDESTRDGRLLINTVLDEAAAPITLLTNWNPEAKP